MSADESTAGATPTAPAVPREKSTGLHVGDAAPGVAKVDPIIIADGIKRVFGGLTAVDVDHLEIPRGAMVIATCDALHAMTSDRTYRKAMSVTEAEAELRTNSGTQFEPGTVEALLAELAVGRGSDGGRATA